MLSSQTFLLDLRKRLLLSMNPLGCLNYVLKSSPTLHFYQQVLILFLICSQYLEQQVSRPVDVVDFFFINVSFYFTGAADFVEITASNNPLVAFTSDPSTHRQCFNVNITNDRVLEDMENFSLNLSLSEEPRFPVIIAPDSSEVEIKDQDCKSKSY